MSKRKQKKTGRGIRDKPQTRSGGVGVWLGDSNAGDILCSGYTSLAHNPEIVAAVDTIARLIGSMTIHLMANTDAGDIRIKDGLSRKVDVVPARGMPRSNFIQWIVKTMFLEGHGNAVILPQYRQGGKYLDNLQPIPPEMVSFIPNGWSYRVIIAGQEYEPEEVLHFALNPGSYYPWMGQGYTVALSDVANNLKQATATEKGFMQSKWKPSIIVKVDALTEEFASPEGRSRLMEQYLQTTQAGEPWIIPAEQFSVEQVRPLSLSDLALADFVTLDKKTVASIIGVPPFVLGVGEFKRDEWNNFISTTVMAIAKIIEQVLTRGLLISPELYFRFNARSLYNYNLKEMAEVADEQYIRGIMTGNEVRDWIGLPPKDGLDQLVILENYLPIDRLGDQKKLIQNGGDA